MAAVDCRPCAFGTGRYTRRNRGACSCKVVTRSACVDAQRERLDLVNAKVLGVRAKERADGGDLVGKGQARRKGRKRLHDVQVEVSDEKEMYLFQPPSSVAILPDME